MLRKINKQLSALAIGGGKGETKTVAGFLIGARYHIGRVMRGNKEIKKGSTLFQCVDAKGQRFDVWGSASINGALYLDGRDVVDPSLIGKWIVIRFVGMGKKQPGKNAQKISDLFIDDAKKMPATAGYIVKMPAKN